MRVDFDASTIVGAALKSESIPHRALLLARERHIIALSRPVIVEITHVLARPKFARVLTKTMQTGILVLLEAAAIWAEPERSVSDCRDAKDNKYLELALATGAEIIVSSDDDLLTLDPWRGIRILRPREFMAAA